MSSGSLNELRGNAHAVAGAADRTFQDVRGAKLLTYLLRGHRLVPKSKHLRSGKDFKLGDLRQLGDDIFGNSIAEILVLFCTALIFEVEHTHRFALFCKRVRPGTGNAFFCGRPTAGLEVALEALEISAEFGGRLAAQIEVLLQYLTKNSVECDWQVRVGFH